MLDAIRVWEALLYILQAIFCQDLWVELSPSRSLLKSRLFIAGAKEVIRKTREGEMAFNIEKQGGHKRSGRSNKVHKKVSLQVKEYPQKCF